MGTGQMLLALVALTLLASVTLSANKLILTDTDVVQGSEAMITGTAIGQAMLEEITVKYFDQNVLPPLSTDVASAFTPPDSLGPDSSDVAGADTTYNDIDDYNGYADSVNTPRLGYFNRKCEVFYVHEDGDSSTTQTFQKKIVVTVTNPYLGTPGHSIELSQIVSYRYKD